MKKGFTLIELLSVIAILGILAFITTYAVINIIKDADEDAATIGIDRYVAIINENILNAKAAKNNVPSGTYQIMTDGNLCIGTYANETCTGRTLDLHIDSSHPTSGTVVISGSIVVSATNVNINGKIVSYNVNGEEE